jgi:amino acid transporter
MAATKKFGTFLGVFLPGILTFLGLVMYLRFGWVLGNLGLGGTLAAVAIASLITFITALSAASIATNIRVGVGGVYYIVSRSFGLQTGGAIGIAFYISRTLSITFYAFGLAESILLLWPTAVLGAMPAYAVPLLTALIIITVTLVASKSTALALQAQVPIFILVLLSIVALIIGVFQGELRAIEWEATYRTVTADFWVVFAVFFPGVTGFLAGISMSGDLKDPAHSIPRGTITSLIAGTLIYMIIPVLLAVTAKISYEEMADSGHGLQAWSQVAFLGGLIIYPAAWGAILSTTMSSILSGPRLLQSLSMDGSMPGILSRLSKSGQPAVATWVTGGIALLAVALGDLNTVAKYVTVIFLTLYVVINLVAAIEKLVAEPSFRPKFHVAWYLSLTGAIAALIVMYLISPLAMLIALGLELGFYFYLKKRALEQQWGDVNAGFWVQIARFALLRMNQRKVSARNWRPKLLVFVKDIHERIELVKLAAALGQNRGVLTVSKMVYEDDVDSMNHLEEIHQQMKEDLRSYGLEAFCEVNVVRSIHRGVFNITRGHGIAGLKTNTVIFGWSGTLEGDIQQLKTIRRLSVIRKNILLVKFNDHQTWLQKTHQQIDIWWSGHQSNGDLMLILAYMLQLNREWERAKINIRAVVETEAEQLLLASGIARSIEEARISASISVLLKGEERFPEIAARESQKADVAILGLQVTKEGEEETHARKLEEISNIAKTVIFMQNNSVEETLPILLKVEE